MTICFALILVLVYSIMCLSIQENNEKHHGINCRIDQPFHSAYITPVIEQITDVTGCQSTDTASDAQEVHILSLLNSGFDDPVGARNGYLPIVSLDVRPRLKQKDHASPTVIVVLHSIAPVMWQMNLHHMGNSTSFHIVVNKPSYVVPSVTAYISRQKLPSIKRLPSWVKSHHGAVTSFSSISLANEITLFIGRDPNAGPVCDFNSELKSVNVKASYVKLQPATGCAVNNSQNNEKKYSTLHVIELNSSGVNGDVLIHLRQFSKAEVESSKHTVVKQNLTLVLKCHVPVEWIIESSGIEGSLRVVAEYPVHIRTNPLYVTTLVQEKALPAETSALLNSVQNVFGAIDTFLKTLKTNKISIAVQGETKLLLNTNQTQNNTLTESTLKHHPTFPGSDVSHIVNKIKTAVTDSQTKDQPLISRLVEKMILECFADKMSISFPFDETMAILTSAFGSHSKLASVSLVNTNCKAELNESHIVLQSFWNDCGTRSVSNGEETAYHNQVQFITTKYQSGKDSVNEPKHLPTDDDDYISEDGSGSDDLASARQKYHKEEQVIYPLPVFCSPSVIDRNKNVSSQSSSEKYELHIYTKKDFRQAVSQQSFPLNVVVHEHLFAEALIKADSRLCINVDECWLSENDGFNKNEDKKSTLIKQGCPTDLSVDILSKSHCGSQEDVDHYRMRFSFQLSEDFINQHLYLHCRFTSCAMRDSKQLKMKQCVVNENFCTKPNLRPYLDPLRGKKYSMIVQGPFHVMSKSKMEKGKDLLSFANPGSSSSPENFVVDYSFDKLTGNNKKNPVSQQLVFIGLSTEAVVGIAFASFIIGAGLMATLWLIHMHTEPSRRFKQNRKQSSKQYQNENQLNYDRAECVDNSVPSSLKPMSVHICT